MGRKEGWSREVGRTTPNFAEKPTPDVPPAARLPRARILPMHALSAPADPVEDPKPPSGGTQQPPSGTNNMEIGERKARAALAANSPAERRKNLAAQMRALSQNSPSGRASIGAVMGAIKAIGEATGVSDAEKYSLMQTVINADNMTTQDKQTLLSMAEAGEGAAYAPNLDPYGDSPLDAFIMFTDEE